MPITPTTRINVRTEYLLELSETGTSGMPGIIAQCRGPNWFSGGWRARTRFRDLVSGPGRESWAADERRLNADEDKGHRRSSTFPPLHHVLGIRPGAGGRRPGKRLPRDD